jgi:hypothetical protein
MGTGDISSGYPLVLVLILTSQCTIMPYVIGIGYWVLAIGVDI